MIGLVTAADAFGIGGTFLEAWVDSTTALIKGSSAIGRELIGGWRRSAGAAHDAAVAIIRAPTTMAAGTVQGRHLAATVELWFRDGTKLSELSLRVANETLEPLASTIDAAVDRWVGQEPG